MGWFDEQIRLRRERDAERFEESMMTMASAVVGRRLIEREADLRAETVSAIDDILKYFHKKPVEIPDDIEDTMAQLEYALRPYGIMHRQVDLTDKWYRDAAGPMLVFRKESGLPAAAIPDFLSGYRIRGESGNWERLNEKTAGELNPAGICFYTPLPEREIGIGDLLRYMWQCITPGDLLVFVALTFISILTGMLLSRLTRFMADFVINSKSISLLLSTAVYLLCVNIAKKVIDAASSLASARIQSRTSVAVESAVMMRLMNLPSSFFRKYSSGELSSRAQSVNNLCALMIGNVFSMGLTSVFSLVYVTQIYRFAPGLALPALGIIAVTLIFTLATTFLQMRILKQKMESAAKESGLAYALITGVQKIRLAGAEKRAFAKWGDAYAKVAQYTYNLPFYLKISKAVSLGISVAGTAILYIRAVQTGVTPANYLAFNATYGMVMGAFMSLADIAASIAQIQPILEMAKPILETAPEIRGDKQPVDNISGEIELSHVSFRYREDMPYVLDDLNLKIRAGEYVAVVGRTGCGKSTLMRLLLGFEKPERGAVSYDGRDIDGIDLRSLRKKIGVVTQDGSLFPGDIYSNIVISAPHLSVLEAWVAAEVAGIADDIRAMPMGMNTMISEGQGGISGGQKQRLMIARAIAPKPKVLMFDEATSALDNNTQRKISEALDRLKCTRIVIAHRLSTIRNCDRIILLEDGAIKEDGTYEELIALNGSFADLVARQRVEE